MKTTLTPQQVWEAILADPNFVSQTPEGSPQREAIRPFIEGSVKVLEDDLETIVTLQSLAGAKIKFMRHCIDNGIYKLMGDAIGMDSEMIEGMLTEIVEVFESIFEDTPAFLEKNDLTEESLMLSPQVGMNPENQQKWREGTLTIGELLLTQPGVILQNTN